MISTQVLKYLIKRTLYDANVLFENKRHAGAIYLGGYALEIALKTKICRTLQFQLGFPENKQELAAYLNRINRSNPQPLIIKINEIKNHDLQTLLFYSGAEAKIRNLYLKEWALVSDWNPEQRYKKQRVLLAKSEGFLKAVKVLVKEIS